MRCQRPRRRRRSRTLAPSSLNWCVRRGPTACSSSSPRPAAAVVVVVEASPAAWQPAPPAASERSRCSPSTGCWVRSSGATPCRLNYRPAWAPPYPTSRVLLNRFLRSDRFECFDRVDCWICRFLSLFCSFLTEKSHVAGPSVLFPHERNGARSRQLKSTFRVSRNQNVNKYSVHRFGTCDFFVRTLPILHNPIISECIWIQEEEGTLQITGQTYSVSSVRSCDNQN